MGSQNSTHQDMAPAQDQNADGFASNQHAEHSQCGIERTEHRPAGHLQGHRIVVKGRPRRKYYADTGERAYLSTPRPCAKCGLRQTPEGHDACITNLPGVSHACCGHGVEDGYIKFETGHIICGKFDHLEEGNAGQCAAEKIRFFREARAAQPSAPRAPPLTDSEVIQRLANKLEEAQDDLAYAASDKADLIEHLRVEFRALRDLVEESLKRSVPIGLRLALDAFEEAVEAS